MATKTTTTTKVPKKTKVAAPKKAVKDDAEIVVPAAKTETVKVHASAKIPEGKYVFATGRRKTAVANIRLFSGSGKTLVNKKPLEGYFNFSFYRDIIEKPFGLTGQTGDFHFTATVNGGGLHAQATAVQHGIAIAISKASPEHRQILKKNGMLTRDDRKKERKKPGLKRARRSPQWAKR